MTIVQIADLWEENQELLKQTLGQSRSTRFGARWVFMPEVPSPKFNHVSRIRLPEGDVDALIEACRTFFKDEGLPGCCLMTTPATQPEDLGARLYRLGFTSESNPVMVWDGSTRVTGDPSVRVEPAPREQSATLFDLVQRVFFPKAAPETIARGQRGVEISYEIGAKNYIAYVGKRPVGAGMLFCRGGMAGIYNMCTLPEYRGRGVATAIIAACLADAEGMNCTHVGLTPTDMGRPLYERLGFQEVYRETYFVERFRMV